VQKKSLSEKMERCLELSCFFARSDLQPLAVLTFFLGIEMMRILSLLDLEQAGRIKRCDQFETGQKLNEEGEVSVASHNLN